jgi:hypothetical protein
MHILSMVSLLVLAILQLCDGLLTARVLARGGWELNPVMHYLMDKLGITAGLILPKLVLTVLLWLYVSNYPLVLVLLVITYLIVVVHNWQQLSKD